MGVSVPPEASKMASETAPFVDEAGSQDDVSVEHTPRREQILVPIKPFLLVVLSSSGRSWRGSTAARCLCPRGSSPCRSGYTAAGHRCSATNTPLWLWPPPPQPPQPPDR